MRERSKILASLETVYRDAYEAAEAAGDKQEMSRLDLGYQRDQIYLETLLDIRDGLAASEEEKPTKSLLERAEALKRLARLRPADAMEGLRAAPAAFGSRARETGRRLSSLWDTRPWNRQGPSNSDSTDGKEGG